MGCLFNINEKKQVALMFKDIKYKISFCILSFSLISLFYAILFLLVKKGPTLFLPNAQISIPTSVSTYTN